MEKNIKSIALNGVRIDSLDFDSALDRIMTALGNGKKTAVFTPNAEMLYRAHAEKRLAELLNSGNLNLADGVGAVWAARMMGTPLPGRIPGIEIGEAAIAECAKTGRSVFLLGGARGIAERAAARLKEKYPGLCICGTHHGYFNPYSSENREVLRKINEAAPDLLVVCFGFPRQEEWIAKNRENLPSVKVFMGLGGALDAWSGSVRRAPVVFRRAGLEWFWRILVRPSRLPRAAALPAFVYVTLRERRRQRRAERCKERGKEQAQGVSDHI